MNIQRTINSLAKALHREFCKKYGELIDLNVAVDFLYYIDDLREINDKFVDYLFDYACDRDIITFRQF